jgi:excisionase family DNA binding protein
LRGSQRSGSVPAPPARRIIRRRPAKEEERLEPEPLLYDIAGACRMLGGISRGTFYALVKKKELRTVKIGGRTLVSYGELKRYVDSL